MRKSIKWLLLLIAAGLLVLAGCQNPAGGNDPSDSSGNPSDSSDDPSDSDDPAAFGQWTWVSGSSTGSQDGIYGAQGVADSDNVPGARSFAVSWTDDSGNLWLFGGWGYDENGATGELNDLWRFDGTDWTWISGSSTVGQAGTYGSKGVAAAANTPGARSRAVSWTDNSGNLWLFGGFGYDFPGAEGSFNDLWRFDVTTLEWAWISGSSVRNEAGEYGTQGVAAEDNVPSARDGAVSWTDDSGNLWLFGGSFFDVSGLSTVPLNDLWRFNINTSEWTWVSGSKLEAFTYGTPGIYGAKGVASASNVPGSRDGAASWTDASGNLWLFGGWGYADGGTIGELNDLWRFDVTTTEWTWVSGSSTAQQRGTYGTQGVADAGNEPGAREQPVSWTDDNGNLLLFGGGYDDGNAVEGYALLNDLWRFNVTTSEWTWVSGSSTIEQRGTYGTQGVADAANFPGARGEAVAWSDDTGNVWLFGGYGYHSGGVWPVELNDLWRFEP
jgi:N-acetylneuraminic acid mutarotase